MAGISTLQAYTIHADKPSGSSGFTERLWGDTLPAGRFVYFYVQPMAPLLLFAGGMTTDRETSVFVCFDQKDFVGSKEQVHVRNTTLPQLHRRLGVLGSGHCSSAPKL